MAEPPREDEFLLITVEAPIPKGTRRHELAYQLDETAVIRQYKPDPAYPWTSFLESAIAKRSGLG